jgi:dolichol-phosphate mannosyltransferase
MQILVAVPTYNEAGNVMPLVEGIFGHVPEAHVVFIDDGSTDGTQKEIAALVAAHPGRVHLIARGRKLGLGTAYVAAFQWALARDYAAVVEMDADLSHRPVDLAKIVAALERHPVVVGSRYVPGGGTENWGLGRRLISRAGSFYARQMLRVDVKDFTGGFNGWRRQVLIAIDPKSIESEGYAFQIELKYRAARAGFPPHEVPITFVERRVGQSKMSGGIVREAMLRIFLMALRGATKRLRGSASLA